jgi:hypothetical protein
LNAGKQMMVAMTLYVNENNDFFPPNADGGTMVPATTGAVAMPPSAGRMNSIPTSSRMRAAIC